jgi:plasmid stability protein
MSISMNKPSEAITVRGLEPGTKRRLRALAAEHGHSMEEEARRILRDAIAGRSTGMKAASGEEDLGTAIHRRFAKYGGLELNLPPRGPDREPPDFSE